MKYLDSGAREEANSLARWLHETLKEDLLELRLQTGFFSSSSLGLFLPTLGKFRDTNYLTRILIGANDGDTVKDDLVFLAASMGLARDQAFLGIVSFIGAYFHPKTYHFKRADGSETAYVGSANLTSAGLALHVEAGIILDTREGDSPNHLQEIASAIDHWFSEQRDGITIVNDLSGIEELAIDGIISYERPTRVIKPHILGVSEEKKKYAARLKRLFTLPQLSPNNTVVQKKHTAEEPHTQLSFPRNGFPAYVLFAPNATMETVGPSALTGNLLPGLSKGLIIQLNRDSARHFTGGSGTANISIPVATISTIRFGISGKHSRPTSKFGLALRYLSDGIQIMGEASATSIMGYGFTAKETGHGDIRMLAPVSVRRLADLIKKEGKPLPGVGNIAFLEWPEAPTHDFKLTFLDSNSMLYQQAINVFEEAITKGEQVGNGACWLSAGISPPWSTDA